LVNLKGEVVGINTWITTPTGINIGLGFAIPINNAKRAIADIIDLGIVEYGWLGVEVEDVNAATAEQLGFDRHSGAVVSQVFGGSPASTGGILPGDIVTEIDGTLIRDYPHLVRLVGDKRAGEQTIFTIFRHGDLIERTVAIGRRQSDAEIERANRTMWPGLSVVPLGETLKATLNLPRRTEGLFIEDVKPAAGPQSAGIRRGDVLLAINDVEMKNLLDFYRAVNDTQSRDFHLEILRSGEVLSFSVRRG
jgi:S1-C subfamily serine protease